MKIRLKRRSQSGGNRLYKNIMMLSVILTVILISIPVGYTMVDMGIFSKEPVITTEITAGEDAPVLKIVCDDEFKPKSYINADGAPAGADVEVAIEAANRLGMRPEFVFSDWITARDSLNSGNADIILGLEIFSNMKGVLKTIPISGDKLNVYGKTKVTDAASLAGKRVGLMAQSVIISMFELNCEYVEYYTNPDILRALEDGEVDFVICHGSIANHIIKENNYNLVECFPLMESYPAIGVREDETELHEKLNQVLQEMADDGVIRKLEDKWVTSSINYRSCIDVINSNSMFYVGYLALFMFVEFLLILFIVQARYYVKSMRYNEMIKEHYSLLNSMAEMYFSTHLIHLKDNTVSELRSDNLMTKYSDANEGADEQMRRMVKKTIVPEMQEDALKFIDLPTLSERMGDNKILTTELLQVYIGWIRVQFVAVGYDDENKVSDVIFTTLAIDHEKKKEEYLIQISNSDELTGIYNRHAYETDMVELRKFLRDDFAVISLDLNGLKFVNDTYGHKAGDNLLQSASACIDASLGKYGKVYRVGGDEFMALIYVEHEEIKEIIDMLRKNLEDENKKIEHKISISCGYASHAENLALNVDELVLMADKKMYQEKAEHYKTGR